MSLSRESPDFSRGECQDELGEPAKLKVCKTCPDWVMETQLKSMNMIEKYIP